MSFLPSRPLPACLPRSDADALRWSLHVACALQYLHELQPPVLHRDLKLDNVMLSCPQPSRAEAKLVRARSAHRSPPACPSQLSCRGGEGLGPRRRSDPSAAGPCAVQADFGLARMHQEAAAGRVPAAAALRTGSQVAQQVDGSRHACRKPLDGPPAAWLTGKTGSLGYMAPEVLASRPYGASADVFRWLRQQGQDRGLDGCGGQLRGAAAGGSPHAAPLPTSAALPW